MYNSKTQNWPILLADTSTDTETTFQRENLVTDSVGYFFHHKGALKTKFAGKFSIFSGCFWVPSRFIFKLIKTHISKKQVGNMRKIWNWKFRFWKKNWLRYRNRILVSVPDNQTLVSVVHYTNTQFGSFNLSI